MLIFQNDDNRTSIAIKYNKIKNNSDTNYNTNYLPIYSLTPSVSLINCRFTLGFPSLSATVHFPTNRLVTSSYTRFVDMASWLISP